MIKSNFGINRAEHLKNPEPSMGIIDKKYFMLGEFSNLQDLNYLNEIVEEMEKVISGEREREREI